MTSRDELVDLIAATAVDALDWHWEERLPYVLSPEDCFRHVAEAIYEALADKAEAGRLWPHYTSTYCIHGQHGDCRLSCKVCHSLCRCGCHEASP